MKLNHISTEQVIEWTPSKHIFELIIESPILLRSIIKDLINFDNTNLSLTDGSKVYDFKKDVDLIFNPLNLDFNNKKAILTLLKLLVKTSTSEEYYMQTNELKSRILKYLNELIDSENFVFDVEADDFTLDSIAKAVNLHIVGDEDDYIELLTDYLSMMSELASIKLFIFVNFRGFIKKSELERFIKNINNHQIDVLLIESRDLGTVPDISRLIIDSDLCEI